MRLRAIRAVTLFLTAAVGMLAAHELDYRLIVPDPTHRHDLLLRTGHGYLSHALAIALAAGAVAATTAVALGFARARTRERRASRWSVALPLALVQSGGFVALEAVERVVVGAPPDDRLLVVTLTGVALQLVVAFAAAVLLDLLARAGAAVAARVARRGCLPRAHAASASPVSRRAPRPAPLGGSAGLRSPPAAISV